MAEASEKDLSLGELVDERRHLLNIAFRMLGTTSDAEDVVQETYARWFRLPDEERAAIQAPRAWLTRVASRICLDLLGSARVRREQYVGEWLPEPLPETAMSGASQAADPLDRVTLDESVSMALLVLLESLTPAERVAFVLHDVFGLPFAEVAAVVGRTPQASRKLASSARAHLRDGRNGGTSADQHTRTVAAFWEACQTGNLQALIGLLDPEVTTLSDGGGKVRAALNPVRGADRTARFLLGVLSKQPAFEVTMQTVAGRTGLVFRQGVTVAGVVSLNVQEGRIRDVWVVVNPDKLRSWNLAQP